MMVVCMRQQVMADRDLGFVDSMDCGCMHHQVIAGTETGFVYRIRVEGNALQALLLCENHSAPVKAVQYAKV
jgi:hypothetical protein